MALGFSSEAQPMSQGSLSDDKIISGGVPIEVGLPDPGSHDFDEAGTSNRLPAAIYAGVLIFCVLYFFRPEDFVPALAEVPMQKIVGLFMIVALVCAIVSKRVNLVPEVKLLLALWTYFCLCIPGSLWAGGSFDLIINGFSKTTLVVIAAMCAVTTLARLRTMMLVQTTAMLTMALLSFGQDRKSGRMYGVGKMFGDPNDLALNLCIILPFCVALLLSSRTRFGKLFWASAVAVALLAIVSTYSRGGFLALITVFLTMYHQFRIRARTAALVLVVIAGFAGVALLVGGKSSYLDRMGTITDTKTDSTGSAQQRRELLARSLEVTLRHPVFGVGPGQFQQVSGYWLQTHNTYTQLSAEAGIPALILFLIIIKRTFKNLRLFRTTAERDEPWYLARALYCAMAGYLVGAFFLGTAYWMIPYLLLAYSSVLRKVSETYPVPMEQADSSILRVA